MRLGVYHVDRDGPPEEWQYTRLALYDTETGEWSPDSSRDVVDAAPAGDVTLRTLDLAVSGRRVVVRDADDLPGERVTVDDADVSIAEEPYESAPLGREPWHDGPPPSVPPTAVVGVIVNAADGVAYVETDGCPREYHLQVPTATDALPKPVIGAVAAVLLSSVAPPETVDDPGVADRETVDLTPVERGLETLARRTGPDPDLATLVAALGGDPGAVAGADDPTDAARRTLVTGLADLRAAVEGDEIDDERVTTDRRLAGAIDLDAVADAHDAVGIPGRASEGQPPTAPVDGAFETPWTHPVDRILVALAG